MYSKEIPNHFRDTFPSSKNIPVAEWSQKNIRDNEDIDQSGELFTPMNMREKTYGFNGIHSGKLT